MGTPELHGIGMLVFVIFDHQTCAGIIDIHWQLGAPVGFPARQASQKLKAMLSLAALLKHAVTNVQNILLVRISHYCLPRKRGPKQCPDPSFAMANAKLGLLSG